MEFFGITLYGPQNYIGDLMNEEYREPTRKEEVLPLMQKIVGQSPCPEKIKRPDASVIRVIDCYIGRVNGFAYGSTQRFNKMKRKGVIKPAGPADIYRLPPTTSFEARDNKGTYCGKSASTGSSVFSVLMCSFATSKPRWSIGWFLCDPNLTSASWYQTYPRHPQPASPNTLILDKVRKNNKYATLF